MRVSVLIFLLLMVTACTKKQAAHELVDLVAKGKAVYATACTACHNIDPMKDGSLGPAIAGSSLALIESRVVSAGYPEGYKPKRETRLMVALPHLKSDVPAIHAYLNSLGK